MTTHIVRVPLWLLRTDDMITFTSEKKKKKDLFLFEKDGQKYDELVAINGGGGLAGYICPWLPHLP